MKFINYWQATALLTSALTLSSTTSAQSPQEVSANDFIQLFEQLNGKQPGHRKAHARGVCAAGQFIPQQSEPFSSAALLNSGKLSAMLRFSVGGGNPNADERQPGTRGLGLQLSDNKHLYHVFTGNNFPVFAGKDPQTFFGLLQSRLPDKEGKVDPDAFQRYVRDNPSVQANVAWQQQAKIPASYSQTQFFGLHTFYYGADDKATKFRWELVPESGVAYLTEAQAAQQPSAFLEDVLQKTLKQGDIAFRLEAVLGLPEDSINDPSVQWPQNRERIVLGRVLLTSVGGDSCTIVNFDPNRISKGFSTSNDPVLKMRSAAYAISFAKRLSHQ